MLAFAGSVLLVWLGRRRIGTVSGPQDMPAGQARLTGFLDALAAHGIHDVAAAEGDFTHAGGAAAMRRLLTDRPDLDGVFIASDLMALGAIPVLLRAGKEVPRDVALVGFDTAHDVIPRDRRLDGSLGGSALLARGGGVLLPGGVGRR